MEYSKATINRVFVIKFEHNDDLLKELKNLIVNENIKAGIIYLIGALEKAEIVVGPEKISIPPVPINISFSDGREILGIGTIFWNENNEPKIHIHAGIGRENIVNLGCVRKNTKVYLTIEAILIELKVDVKKKFDEKTGIDLLNFS